MRLWECQNWHVSSSLSVGLIAFWFLGLLESKHTRGVSLVDCVSILFRYVNVCM
jgi:hypothetical protein